MAFTITTLNQVREGSSILSSSNQYVVEANYKLAETIAANEVDKEVQFSIEIAKLKVFTIQNTVDMTLKTNSSSTPQETFVLPSNRILVWQEDDTAIFAGDVTTFFISNATADQGVFNCIAGLDN